MARNPIDVKPWDGQYHRLIVSLSLFCCDAFMPYGVIYVARLHKLSRGPMATMEVVPKAELAMKAARVPKAGADFEIFECPIPEPIRDRCGLR